MNWPEAIAVTAGITGCCFIIWCYLRSEEPFRAPPGHGLGRRVLRDAVRPPAYPGIPMDQDADAPQGDAQDDEQMNRFHECRMGETPNPGNL